MSKPAKIISKAQKKVTPSAYKTTWDLKDVYASINDPKIEKDVQSIEKAYTAFARAYGSRTDYLHDQKALLSALQDWELLMKATSSWKPVWYLHLITDNNTADTKAKMKRDLLESRLIKAANQVLFFEINLGKISSDVQKQILGEPAFAPYKYYLERIFITARYDLSEAEEKILNLQSQPAHSMWVDAQKNYLYSQTVRHRGKQIPLSEALEIKAQLPLKERRALHAELIKKCKEISFFATAELNAVVTGKKIRDELRGFDKPYQSTILRYLNDQKSIESLVRSVTAYYKLSQKFYKLKAKLMNLPHLTYADIAVSLSSSSIKFPLEKGVSLISESFQKAGQEFSDIFTQMLQNGKIDIFPKAGKRSGAYCSGGANIPTCILMNYTDSLQSVTTLAHEMGHAIHTELSKSQPPLYEDYPISLAEVASTFFENLIFDEVFQSLSEKNKVYALCNRTQDDISTIFRQIAFFNFEYDLHTQIRQKGGLSNDEIAHLFKTHLERYLGSSVQLEEADSHTFVYISHFRSFFYVYSYAYGQLISKALYSQYKKNPQFIEKVKQFLKAGSSASPEDIFMSIGIDTTKPEFFEEGLKAIEEDLKELEKRAKKNNLI